jgi:hypothetical protein
MPIVGLLEVGTRILRRHARILLTVAVVVQLPGAVLDAVGQQRLADSVAPLLVGLDTDSPSLLAPTESQAGVILGALLLVGGAMLASMILGAVATVGYARVAADDYHGRTSTLGGVLGVAFRRAFAAIGAAVLAALAVVGVIAATVALALALVLMAPGTAGQPGGLGAFLALVVGVGGGVLTLTLLVRLSLATIVVALEGVRPLAGIRRSWHLTGTNAWRTFAVLVILALVISILASLLVQLLGVLLTDTIGAQLGLAGTFDALAAAAVSVLFAPVAAVVQTVLYFDLRVRRDRWDLPALGLDPSPAGDQASGADDAAGGASR